MEKKQFIPNNSDMSNEQFYEEIDNDVFEKIKEITQDIAPNLPEKEKTKEKQLPVEKPKEKQKKTKSTILGII